MHTRPIKFISGITVGVFFKLRKTTKALWIGHVKCHGILIQNVRESHGNVMENQMAYPVDTLIKGTCVSIFMTVGQLVWPGAQSDTHTSE